MFNPDEEAPEPGYKSDRCADGHHEALVPHKDRVSSRQYSREHTGLGALTTLVLR